MAIIENTGSLLDQRGILVHGCNCMGKMKSGVADLIRGKYPAAYRAYNHRYEVFGLQLGDIIAVAHPSLRDTAPEAIRHIAAFDDSMPTDVVIVNGLTQYDYGRNKEYLYADYTAILAAFIRVRMLAQALRMPVHFPLVGCGLANGKWAEVGPRIDKALGKIDGNLWLLPGTSAQ